MPCGSKGCLVLESGQEPQPHKWTKLQVMERRAEGRKEEEILKEEKKKANKKNKKGV